MSRTWLRWLLGVLVVLVLAGVVGRQVQVWRDSQPVGARAPYLQMPAPDAMTVRWRTAAPVRGEVRYGTAPDRLDQRAGGVVSADHAVRLTGLQPATRYYYALDADGQPWRSGEDTWFFTPPRAEGAGPARFLVLGDPGQPGFGAQAVRDAALRVPVELPRTGPQYDFILAPGDLAYTSGRDREYQAALFDVWGALLARVTLWPGYGNHDARRRAYFGIFDLPTRGESGGLASGTEHYYSFDHGPLHVVVLDSQDSDLDADGAQARWLQADLAAAQAPWRIVAVHHPPYSKGTHDSDAAGDSGGRMRDVRVNLLPLLEQAGVDLVIAAHSHGYERSQLIACHYGTSDTFAVQHILDGGAPGAGGERRFSKAAARAPRDGAVHVVVGSSSKADQAGFGHPALPVALAELGALVVEADRERLVARFVDARATVRDRFSLQRDAAAAHTPACAD